jgi:hypothetical protein
MDAQNPMLPNSPAGKQDFITPRLPRTFTTLVQESVEELKQVKNIVYEGQVVKGIRNGLGQMIYPNGDVYKGAYKNGVRNGQGTCKFGQTGAIYKGEWKDDKPYGNGLLFSLPNEIIEGRFDGYRITDGQVKILFTNGEFFEGVFKHDQRNATGTHYYKNGDSYEGEWVNDRRVGRGRIQKPDGGFFKGFFAEDKAEGYIEYEDRHGNQFVSENDEAKNSSKPVQAKKKVSLASDKPQPGQFMNARLYK